jgi:hypothetical protein
LTQAINRTPVSGFDRKMLRQCPIECSGVFGADAVVDEPVGQDEPFRSGCKKRPLKPHHLVAGLYQDLAGVTGRQVTFAAGSPIIFMAVVTSAEVPARDASAPGPNSVEESRRGPPFCGVDLEWYLPSNGVDARSESPVSVGESESADNDRAASRQN